MRERGWGGESTLSHHLCGDTRAGRNAGWGWAIVFGLCSRAPLERMDLESRHPRAFALLRPWAGFLWPVGPEGVWLQSGTDARLGLGYCFGGFFEVEFLTGVVDGAEDFCGGFGETAEGAGDVWLDDVEVAAGGTGPLP